jgi:hypothetical protein
LLTPLPRSAVEKYLNDEYVKIKTEAAANAFLSKNKTAEVRI